jgi:hypothetical protein
MALTPGLEPGTVDLEKRRSIQLSYVSQKLSGWPARSRSLSPLSEICGMHDDLVPDVPLRRKRELADEAGFEPATNSLTGRCSTAELLAKTGTPSRDRTEDQAVKGRVLYR